MGMIIECVCGAVTRGGSEQELLESARSHIRREHPGLGEPPSDADLLGMAAHEPLEPSDPPTGRRRPRSRAIRSSDRSQGPVQRLTVSVVVNLMARSALHRGVGVSTCTTRGVGAR
jgi:hypothetical protein